MFPAQIPKITPDEFSRCEEQSQSLDSGKRRSPIQKTDSAVKDSIYHALWKDVVLRAIDYDEIEVHVKNGIAYLSGHIVNSSSQFRIINVLHEIPGILAIKNNLVLDDELTLKVSTSLGKLEHTYDCKFFTGATHGVVSLNGVVSNENVKLLAEKCAASNPNVRGVINNVRVSGSEPPLKEQPFIQPTIGEIIYFLDWLSGVVKQVIINPNNRRVIAMVVQGKFMNQHYESLAPGDDKAKLSERLITIPMDTVRYITKISGFLYIKSSERNRYLDFDSASFSAPERDWVPPYPYCLEDVLFLIEQPQENQLVQPLLQFLLAVTSKEQVLWEQLLDNDSLGG
jgi:osmotically-inducible protein OsmY